MNGVDDELRARMADSNIPTPLNGFPGAAGITERGRTAGQAVSNGLPPASSGASTPLEASRTRPSQQPPQSPFKALASQTFSGRIPTPLSASPGQTSAADTDKGHAGVGRKPPGPIQSPGAPPVVPPTVPPTAITGGPPKNSHQHVGVAVGVETADASLLGTGELPGAGVPAGAPTWELPEEARRADGCGRLPTLNEELEVAGPFLQFLGTDPADSSWRGSVLVVLPPDTPLPVLLLDDGALLGLPSRPLCPVSPVSSQSLPLSNPVCIRRTRSASSVDQ